MLSFLIGFILAVQQPTATPAAPQTRRPTPTTFTAEIRVSDRSGNPLDDAVVEAEGPSSRQAATDAQGLVVFRTMTGGTYRLRAMREGFVALEKEITVRGVARQQIEFALTAAPPPPPPPPPPPAPPPAAPPPPVVIAPGDPLVLDVPLLAEKSLGGREPITTVPIGCSGWSTAQLMVVRESTTTTADANKDQVLYVVAGQATLTLGQKVHSLTPGWLSVVPRGMSYAVTRKGRNPVILLSVLGGQECLGSMSTSLR